MFDPTVEKLEETVLAPQQETIQARFLRYHAEHPDVYKKLCDYARKAKARGYEKIGIGFLVEIIRWQEHIPGKKEGFKIANDYRSRYARLIMQMEPDLMDIFELRELTSA